MVDNQVYSSLDEVVVLISNFDKTLIMPFCFCHRFIQAHFHVVFIRLVNRDNFGLLFESQFSLQLLQLLPELITAQAFISIRGRCCDFEILSLLDFLISLEETLHDFFGNN